MDPSNPIEVLKDRDGVYSVLYFGNVAGWIQLSPYLSERHQKTYRALSVHGDVTHVYSVQAGRDWVLAAYH